ncbi:50S ribosomal protein L5 [Candidatus Saccharibacteria bacterium]|jgi:large subunit ribosomal protein L5|nr:50S ribosomal protein L5 [Candidatus Saccharibacteria bacterium]
MVKEVQTEKYQARLKKSYFSTIRQQLKEELKLANVNEVPQIKKIVVNVGLGKAKDDKRLMEVAINTLSKVTGQRPIETKSKKSIAAFKLRQGNKIGLKVTLRDERMYEFMDRLINIILPRLRDFRGVKVSSFDKQGNYNIGLKDQTVFPELSFEESTVLHGMQISITVKNVRNNDDAQALLSKFGMPFERVRSS